MVWCEKYPVTVLEAKENGNFFKEGYLLTTYVKYLSILDARRKKKKKKMCSRLNYVIVSNVNIVSFLFN